MYNELQADAQLAKSFTVPTNDMDVRTRLRAFGEPITLFGEDKADRRSRLQTVMVARYKSGLPVDSHSSSRAVSMGLGDTRYGSDGEEVGNEDEDDDNEEYYTEGNEYLLDARKDIFNYSMAAVQRRLKYQKIVSKFPTATHVLFRRQMLANVLEKVDILGSQYVSERPASMARFSPDKSRLAVASWSGDIKIFDIPNLTPNKSIASISTPTDKPAIDWNPVPEHNMLAAGGSDGPLYIYKLDNLADKSNDGDTKMENNENSLEEKESQPSLELVGHEKRVARVAFHPNGKYIGSASYDLTWRLWDVQVGRELLVQEGHAKDIFSIKFHPDGSLCATAGYDSIARLWDLRTGRSIMSLIGHVKPIYGLDISSNGYHVATGSADGTVKIWDLRQQRQIFSIPAHTNLVSDIQFFQGSRTRRGTKFNGVVGLYDEDLDTLEKLADTDDTQAQLNVLSDSGSFLVTSSYDRTVKIWNADTWSLVKSLQGHTDKVMSVDIVGGACPSSSNDQAGQIYIASSGWDRTVKLWAKDDFDF